jgi:hypothetical protein
MEEDEAPAKPRKEGPKKAGTTAKETAKASLDEMQVVEAQFSINVINLFDAPKSIHFGKWNPRPLIQGEWKKLKVAMTQQGIKAFTPENMMPLVISARHVEPSCVQNSIKGYEAKALVLSAEGEREVKKLQMAGGRHRMAAMKSIKADKEGEMQKLKKAQGKVSRRKATKPSAVEKKAGELEEIGKKIEELEEEISKIGRWGVILYDEGK